MLLLYYRCYVTQEFMGFLFDMDDSRVCRLIKKLEPLLTRVMAIPKIKVLSKEEAESLILDVTERPIERWKKGQKLIILAKRNAIPSKTKSELP